VALEFLSSNRSSAATLSKLTITLSFYRKTGIKTNPKRSELDGDSFNGRAGDTAELFRRPVPPVLVEHVKLCAE